MHRVLYDLLYRVGAPWEGGPRAELVDLVTAGRIRPGRAVDLGCGTGANAVFLAAHGFDVTGVDFSPVALALARRAAAAAGVRARFVQADLTAATVPVAGPFDLLVDYGTLDDLRGAGRQRMAATIQRLAGPSAAVLLWCFYDEIAWWRRPGARYPGLKPAEVHDLFGADFAVDRLPEPAAGSGFACFLLTRLSRPAVANATPVTPAVTAFLALPVLLPLLALPPGRLRVASAAVLAAVAVGIVGGAWRGSLVPERVGHDPHAGHAATGAGPLVSLAAYRTAPARPGEPVRRFTLTAQRARVALAQGRTAAAWTFDGTVPGPELRVRQGDLVEVLLRNHDIPDGVTIHWHGYEVPAGEDGVAGLTQDAVLPGRSFRYRFRAAAAGTFWYHSHQVSSEAVRRGLFGALVVTPADAGREVLDLAVPLHTLSGALLTGVVDGVDARDVAAGTRVRLRLVNTDSRAHVVDVRGTAYRISAVDGRDLRDPPETQAALAIPAGGRYDLAFTMPRTPVGVVVDRRPDRGLLLGRGPAPSAAPPRPVLDISTYLAGGPPAAAGRVDRDVTLVLDKVFGFRDGLPRVGYPVNGRLWPDIPPVTVRRGDVVRLTVVNRGRESHPMHVHGHAALVLSRNGVPARGSVRTDSFDVGPGEVWQVALRADNPGIWPLHCHNLDHAAGGMVLHLAYAGIVSPHAAGPATGNFPE